MLFGQLTVTGCACPAQTVHKRATAECQMATGELVAIALAKRRAVGTIATSLLGDLNRRIAQSRRAMPLLAYPAFTSRGVNVLRDSLSHRAPITRFAACSFLFWRRAEFCNRYSMSSGEGV